MDIWRKGLKFSSSYWNGRLSVSSQFLKIARTFFRTHFRPPIISDLLFKHDLILIKFLIKGIMQKEIPGVFLFSRIY